MPRTRYRILEPDRPHFLTSTINHWVPIFTRPDTVDIYPDMGASTPGATCGTTRPCVSMAMSSSKTTCI